MKNLFTFFAITIFSVNLFAQAPQKMSYQAVIRNSSNSLITLSPVGMKISILQGSSTGIPVFIETQSATTNSNGLVSLEIGTGSVVTGTFALINWANGPYFIKIETDPTGGTNYTINGTNELMSVPYALFSANSAPGPQGLQGIQGLTGAQGVSGNNGTNGKNTLINTTSISSNTYCINGGIKLEIGLDANNNNILDAAEIDPLQTQYICNGVNGAQGIQGNQGIQGIAGNDGIGGVTTAGSNITITGSGTIISPYVISATAVTTPTYAIGLNTSLGGYIFYVTPDGKHGLVSATQDQLSNGTWAEAQNAINNPINHNASGKNFTDWRLPSTYELSLMYAQRVAIGGFVTTGGYVYWSCVESSTHENIEVYLFTGGLSTTANKSSGSGANTRAIRSF